MPVLPSDVGVEIGQAPDAATEAQWATWIARTERQIVRRAERLGIDPLTLDVETVDDVVLLAVAAHARNPEGVDTLDVSVDDGRVSRRYRTGSGEVAITDQWWSWLFPSVQSGAFSVRPGFESDRLEDVL